TPRPFPHSLLRIRFWRATAVRAQLLSQLDLFCVEVDAENATTVRPQYLNRDLSNQAQTDHGKRVSEGRLCQSHALQPDASQGGESRGVEAHVFRKADAEILRHG